MTVGRCLPVRPRRSLPGKSTSPHPGAARTRAGTPLPSPRHSAAGRNPGGAGSLRRGALPRAIAYWIAMDPSFPRRRESSSPIQQSLRLLRPFAGYRFRPSPATGPALRRSDGKLVANMRLPSLLSAGNFGIGRFVVHYPHPRKPSVPNRTFNPIGVNRCWTTSQI